MTCMRKTKKMFNEKCLVILIFLTLGFVWICALVILPDRGLPGAEFQAMNKVFKVVQGLGKLIKAFQ